MHQIFELPYRLVASEPGRFALLMDDVSESLLPDERTPLPENVEALILDTLARMHATFWNDKDISRLAWLHTPADFLHIMGPRGHDQQDQRGGSARGVDEAVRRGWRAAKDLLPPPVLDAIHRPAIELAAAWADLPRTLVHGDTKIANFAVFQSRRLCAIDWAFTGYAPCTFDIGWYLAVNATRLTQSKEEVLAHYRHRLEFHLGQKVTDPMWDCLEEAGIVCGALMLLWSKATAVTHGTPKARLEWDWWESRLRRWVDEPASEEPGTRPRRTTHLKVLGPRVKGLGPALRP